MNPRTTLLVIALLASPSARADYAPTSLAQLLWTSDAVVVGRISSVEDRTFRFTVTRDLRGAGAEALVVQRFQDWICAVRSKPYAVGQSLLLFLRRPDSPEAGGNEPWQILGAGDEGEIFLDDAPLFLAGGYLGNRGEERDRVRAEDLLDAILAFDACFDRPLIQRCDDPAFEAKKHRSSLHRTIFEATRAEIGNASTHPLRANP